jgi:hypothetical protein
MSNENETQALEKIEPGAAMAIYQSLNDIQAVAKIAAQSRLFGTDDVNKTTILMLRAHADGVNPIYAPTRYHVIKDKISMSAEAMLAVFQETGGKVVWEQHDATRCAGVFSHPKGNTVPASFSVEDAKIAGYLGKDNWKNSLESMLHARAVSHGVRWSYPQATQGLYTPEEINDTEPDKPAPATKVSGDGIEQPADNRPQAERLADSLAGTPEKAPDIEDGEFTDLDPKGKDATDDKHAARMAMIAEIKGINKALGGNGELMKLLTPRGFTGTKEMSNEALAEVLAELKQVASKPKDAAEPDLFSPEEQQRQAEVGSALERDELRKKFFAVVNERLGKGINHHDIIGTEASLNTMPIAEIEICIAAVEKGEFDQLKKGNA